MLNQTRNYVREKYAVDDCENAETAYNLWKCEKERRSDLSSFEIGIRMAEQDYQQKGNFERHPKVAIDLLKDLFDNYAAEVSEFIRGYNSFKMRHRNS